MKNSDKNLRIPFLLRPTGKDYLWGGNRLNDDFVKNIDLSPLAETWECSTHPDGPSHVVSGPFKGETLTEVLKAHPDFLGTHPKTQGELPILIKFIDAKNDLSVQVHPSDEYAMEYENGQLGKTEMWYVLDASKDAKLVYGLSNDVTEKKMREAIANGTVEKYLQTVPVKKDDLFFIKSGTIHAIGAGALIAEIQENSNLTYRLYDYDRIDKNGNKRELHVDKAMAVSNLKSSAAPKQPLRVLKYSQGVARELLCRCKYFEVYRMLVNTERRQQVHFKSDELSFRVLLCLKGCGTVSYSVDVNGAVGDLSKDGTNIDGANIGGTNIDGTNITGANIDETNANIETLEIYKGDCLFIPSDSVDMTLHGKMQFLDVRG